MKYIRIVITTILAVALIFGAVNIAKQMASARNEPQPVAKKIITPVFTEVVANSDNSLSITTSGNLVARDKIDIYGETTGVFESSDHNYKPGTYYAKGAVLLHINSDEHEATIRAQKSSLLNQIVLMLPDLKLDYAESFPQWEAYVQDFDVNQPLRSFPEAINDQEEMYVVGRGIHTAFYTITNLEERLKKYTIRAPFSGVLTETLVYPGALIRNGQRLGQLISTWTYELEVNVNISYLHLLKTGRTVELFNLDRSKSWQGKVIRLGGRVDQSSQTIKAYIQVSGKDLKEGMYLEADLAVDVMEDTYEIDRKLLFDDDKIYYVKDTVLEIAQVEPEFFKEETVIVRGLNDGMHVITRPVPGAHRGMRVEISEF